MRIEVRERVARPSVDVFEALARPDLYLSRWARGVLSATRLPDSEDGPSFRILGRDIGGKVEWLYEVTTSEPGVTLAARARGGPIAFSEVYELEAVEGGTNIRLTQDLRLGAFRAISPVVSLVWPRLMQGNLRGLKRLVESKSFAHGGVA